MGFFQKQLSIRCWRYKVPLYIFKWSVFVKEAKGAKASSSKRAHFLPLKTGTALSPQAKAVQHPVRNRFLKWYIFFCTLYPQTSWLQKKRGNARKAPEIVRFRGLEAMMSFPASRYGPEAWYGSVSNTQKHIENPTFLRHRRTGLLRKSNPPLYRTGADLLIGHTGLGNSPNTS